MSYVSGLGSSEKMEELKLAQAVQTGSVAPATASALKQAQAAWDMRAAVIRNTAFGPRGVVMSPTQVEAMVVQQLGPRPSLSLIPKKVGRVGTAGKTAPGAGLTPTLPSLPVGDVDGGKDNTMLYVGGALALLVVGAIVLRK